MDTLLPILLHGRIDDKQTQATSINEAASR